MTRKGSESQTLYRAPSPTKSRPRSFTQSSVLLSRRKGVCLGGPGKGTYANTGSDLLADCAADFSARCLRFRLSQGSAQSPLHQPNRRGHVREADPPCARTRGRRPVLSRRYGGAVQDPRHVAERRAGASDRTTQGPGLPTRWLRFPGRPPPSATRRWSGARCKRLSSWGLAIMPGSMPHHPGCRGLPDPLGLVPISEKATGLLTLAPFVTCTIIVVGFVLAVPVICLEEVRIRGRIEQSGRRFY